MDADTSRTRRPFHEIEYKWNFGDSSVAAWSHGSRRVSGGKNAAHGPVAAHVFERPGTYKATLNVFDGESSVSRTVGITSVRPARSVILRPFGPPGTRITRGTCSVL